MKYDRGASLVARLDHWGQRTLGAKCHPHGRAGMPYQPQERGHQRVFRVPETAPQLYRNIRCSIFARITYGLVSVLTSALVLVSIPAGGLSDESENTVFVSRLEVDVGVGTVSFVSDPQPKMLWLTRPPPEVPGRPVRTVYEPSLPHTELMAPSVRANDSSQGWRAYGALKDHVSLKRLFSAFWLGTSRCAVDPVDEDVPMLVDESRRVKYTSQWTQRRVVRDTQRYPISVYQRNMNVHSLNGKFCSNSDIIDQLTHRNQNVRSAPWRTTQNPQVLISNAFPEKLGKQ